LNDHPTSAAEKQILIFHIEAIREKEIRKIRITVDDISPTDIKKVNDFKLPQVCTKEIWCKKSSRREFNKMDVL